MRLSAEAFEARLPRTASDGSRQGLRAAITIANVYLERASGIREDRRLSDVGRSEALSKLRAETLQNGHLQQIHTQTRSKLEGLRAERETLRAAAVKPDGDVLSEMQRSEIRGMLRAMSEAARIKLALSDDPAIRTAVAFANPVLSGIPANIHSGILDAIVETKNQNRNSGLAALEAEAEAVAAAVAVAEGTIARG
jgi:hypothetical protein